MVRERSWTRSSADRVLPPANGIPAPARCVMRPPNLAAALLVLLTFGRMAIATTDPPVVKTRRALDNIATASQSWTNTFGCSGCHKQAIPISALGTARKNGYEDAKPGIVDGLLNSMLTLNSGQQPSGCFTLNNGPDSTEATTFGGRGLEAYDRWFGAKVRSNLLSAADCLRSRQQGDGRLASDHTELPVAQGDFITTAHGVFVWNRSFEVSGVAGYSASAAGAVSWLRAQISSIETNPTGFTTQDKALLLAGLASSGAGISDPDVVRMRNLLANDQFTDGSWKLKSSEAGGNAHATGEAIFALRSAGYTRADTAVDRGTQWLLDQQAADGSWGAPFWEGNSPSKVAPSMWGAIALATYPSPLNTLRVTGGASAQIAWSAVDGAASYDVVRGNVSSLAEPSGRVDLGTVSCIAPATSATTVSDSQLPAAGGALYYLFRIRWGTSHDIYGRSSGGRDEIPTTGDCPP